MTDIEKFFNIVKQFLCDHPGLILAATLVSLGLLAASLVLMPVVIVNLPEDHFTRKKSAAPRCAPALDFIGRVVRTVLGLIFLPLGVLLLALPGPGWLTILAGIALLEFPFKKKLEMKVLSLPVVRGTVNSLRGKYHRPPLQFPEPAVHAPRPKGADKKKGAPSPQTTDRDAAH